MFLTSKIILISICLHVLIASSTHLDYATKAKREFRLYQNMLLDGRIVTEFTVCYWRSVDASCQFHYQKIMQGLLYGKPRSSVTVKDFVVPETLEWISFVEGRLAPEYAKALPILKGQSKFGEDDKIAIGDLYKTFSELKKICDSVKSAPRIDAAKS
jgi:hypothetical protein